MRKRGEEPFADARPGQAGEIRRVESSRKLHLQGAPHPFFLVAVNLDGSPFTGRIILGYESLHWSSADPRLFEGDDLLNTQTLLQRHSRAGGNPG